MALRKTADVAVVIPCFNHKRFLAGAIESALHQTVPPTEVLVVDDGSTEDIRRVVSDFAGVRLIRHENRGLAAARNSGLQATTSGKLIFLDADDRLVPEAIAMGLRCLTASADAAFAYGAYREVRNDGSSINYSRTSTHREFVQCNWVGMIATVMFDRTRLLQIGGFDETLRMCEDWDAYLRLSRAFPFTTHDGLVADYVRHGRNASNDLHRLWKWIEIVRAREWERGLDAEGQRAWREGEQIWERMLGPDPGPNHLIARAKRKLECMLRR